jgi:hypothetical protein
MPEKIEVINQFLKENYGIDTDDSEPIFRVVWSEDQFEKRETKYTDQGIELLYPEVREVPKYRSYISNAYVLERRVLVPDASLKELAGLKKSYEPLWVFIGKDGNPVPPTVSGCQFVISCVYAAIGKQGMAKYKDPDAELTPEQAYEKKQAELKKIEDELWGDESGLKGDTIDSSGSTIIMPHNYDKVKH